MSPVFDVPVDALQDAVFVAVAGEPRVTLVAADDKNRCFEWVQRSAIFGFPDRITAVLLSIGENKSTLAIYARSTYGYSDLGVNKARVEKWLSVVKAALESQ